MYLRVGALALFVSFSILNIADLSTDGCFTLGCAVCAMVTLQGHPFLGLLAAMGAGVASGFVTAFLQTRLGVESILAGIIVNTGLYTINIAVMGFSSTINLFASKTIFTMAKEAIGGNWYEIVSILIIIVIVAIVLILFLGPGLDYHPGNWRQPVYGAGFFYQSDLYDYRRSVRGKCHDGSVRRTGWPSISVPVISTSEPVR